MNLITCMLLVLAGFQAADSLPCDCRVHYKKIGCYKDKHGDRALPELTVTERDKNSQKFNGYEIDWTNFKSYLPAFACRCAEAALEKGHNFFGLQFWGECWSSSGSNTEEIYAKHGKLDIKECFGPEYGACDYKDWNCIGRNNQNFVYEIITYNCPLKFERIGCYKDRRISLRPLDKYILTDRDNSHSVSSGRNIDWMNYDTYLPDFACRCAMKAAEKGYDTFGVQFYGECWSGDQSKNKYFGDGESTACINQCYKDCKEYNPFCTGEQNANAVYRIRQDVCEIPYKQQGCYQENKNNRAFSELILNDASPQKDHFIGKTSLHFENKADYLDSFACKCARKVTEKGYTAFSISEDGDECWSGREAHLDFENYGESNDCFSGNHATCGENQVCYGHESSNYVYEIVTEDQSVFRGSQSNIIQQNST